MPIVERIVSQVDVQQRMDIGGVKPQPRNLLQLSGVAHLGALLAEFGNLTMHANQMFESLVADSSAVFQRIRKLSGKVNDVERRMQSLTDAEIAARKFVKTDELTQLQRRSMFMFMSSSTPSSLKVRYNNAFPAPMFDRLDEYSVDGKRCSANYSYPEFFIEQWLIAEKQRQKEAEQRRIKKREERRARRKKEGDKKGKKQQIAGQRIAVKAVAKKKYNVHGQEFVGSVLEPSSESQEGPPRLLEQSSTSHLDSTIEPSSHHDVTNIAQTPENLSSPRSLAAPSPRHQQPQQQQQQQQETLSPSPPPPPPPSNTSAAIDSPLPPPPPPPSASAADSVLSAPPVAPMPPPPPAAPMAPPAPAAPPAPPAAPAAPAAPGAPSVPAPQPDTGRAALLQSIQHGTRLKAVEAPAAAEPEAQTGNQHNDLLSQIRLGKQLRPTAQKDSNTKADVHDDVGPYSEIKKLLDRRQFLSPEGSDSGESEDYDSDEWE